MNTAIKNLFHALVLFFIIILLQNIINTAAELIAISKISIILISCILLMPFCLMFARSEKYFERIAPNINFTLISAFAITISMLIGILSIYSSKMVLELEKKYDSELLNSYIALGAMQGTIERQEKFL